MYCAILKQKLRTAKGMLKHFGLTYIGLIAIISLMATQSYSILLNGGIGVELSEEYVLYFLLFFVALNSFRILFKKAPIITINAATLHYFYFTKHFKRIITIKYIWAFIKSVLFIVIISGVISGFEINIKLVWYFLLLFGYLFLGVLLSWSRYHAIKEKSQLGIILCHIVTSVVFLVESGMISLVLNYCLVLFWIYYMTFKLQFNLTKYSKDIAFMDEITSAGSQLNLAKMSQIAAESEAKKRRKFFLYHFPLKKNTAIFHKCIIELIRVGNRIWGFFASLLLVSFLCYRTPIFSLVPVFGELEDLAWRFSVLLVMIVYLNVGEILKNQANALLKKHKQGLFIPIGEQKIILSYLVVSILIFGMLTIVSGLIFKSKIFFLLLYFILFITVFAIDFKLTLSKSRLSKISHIAMPMLSIMLGLIFLIP